jgi:hypothetical protein
MQIWCYSFRAFIHGNASSATLKQMLDPATCFMQPSKRESLGTFFLVIINNVSSSKFKLVSDGFQKLLSFFVKHFGIHDKVFSDWQNFNRHFDPCFNGSSVPANLLLYDWATQAENWFLWFLTTGLRQQLCAIIIDLWFTLLMSVQKKGKFIKLRHGSQSKDFVPVAYCCNT